MIRRKYISFTPSQPDENYAYATIEEMREVVTKSNHSSYHSANVNQEMAKGESFDHGAYEVVDRDDLPCEDKEDLKTTNSYDHVEYEDMNIYEYVDGDEEGKRDDSEQTQNETDYVSMKLGEETTPCDGIQDAEVDTVTVKNDACTSTSAVKMEVVSYENNYCIIKLMLTILPKRLPHTKKLAPQKKIFPSLQWMIIILKR